MLRGKVHATLIIGVTFFMFGGVSQVAGETLTAEPEILEVIEVELIKVTEPEFITVIEPEFIEITEPDILEPFVSSDGLTKRGGELKSLEYLMCAPLNGLPNPGGMFVRGPVRVNFTSIPPTITSEYQYPSWSLF